MVYLLDANVLIYANATFYPLDMVPPFWDWLIAEGKAGRVKIPPEIAAEITNGRRDPLSAWLVEQEVWDALVIDESAVVAKVRHVIDNGYGPNLDAVVLAKIKADPFLVAHAWGHADRTVVTREVSRPFALPQNRKVPDACDRCGVPWMVDHQFYRAAGFRVRAAGA